MITQYTILQKGTSILGIERGTFESGNKIEKLEREGYVDLDLSLEADSAENAVKKYISGDISNSHDESDTVLSNRSTPISKYGTARMVSSVLQVFGCLTVLGSVIFLILNLNNALLSIIATVGAVVSGLFLIGLAQVILAIVDIANNTSELLKIEKERQ